MIISSANSQRSKLVTENFEDGDHFVGFEGAIITPYSYEV
jgi:hypothetical protein